MQPRAIPRLRLSQGRFKVNRSAVVCSLRVGRRSGVGAALVSLSQLRRLKFRRVPRALDARDGDSSRMSRSLRLPWSSSLVHNWEQNIKLFRLRPEIRRDYPLNLSILISGGKETNKDSLSNGE